MKISNLSNGEQETMKYLPKTRDIIITTAGKGGAVVIKDTENYIEEVKSQLSDKFSYKILQTDRNFQQYT